MAGWLGEVGHRAQTAPSTSAGLELLQTHDFDLVLVEMPHPASEGPEFFRMVREELAREDTAVVFLGPEPPEEALARLDTLAVVPPHCDKRRVTRIADWLVDGSQAAPPLPQKDFERFAHHLERVSGLIFEPKRRTTLEDALRRRMRLVGAEDFEIYYGRLAAGPHARAEEHRLVHLLTIGETSFFRNHAHFEVLREELLPRIRREQERELRRVRLWSAGCSTGEEPYTLAMVALDVFPDAEKWDLRVLATDINLRSLATARRGVYSERALRTTPGSYVDRHFHKESEGRYLIGERVRNLVRFDQVNLASGPYPDRNHAVMCRNVLIYFRREGYVDVVRRIRDSLVPGGALFLGHSETLMGLDLGFQTVQAHHTYYYRKPALDDHLDSTAPPEPASPREPAADRNPPPRPRQS
ncbi:MAG: hypothetical protein HYY25_12245, partial [Candidatus Wallbacteria bacterium]|nr:hypothetical protein [Candidatus Wallbacteria bacterium]